MATFFLSLVIYLFVTIVVSGKCSAQYEVSECPPWMLSSDTGCVCRDSYHFNSVALFCDKTTHTTYIAAGICTSLLSASNKSYGNDTVVVGDCPYIRTTKKPPEFRFYSSLPKTISVNTSDIMCSLFQRQGLLCSSCLPGYGVAPYSYHFPCVKCEGRNYGVLWYILLEFTPITLFYIIVVLFRIRATAAPLGGLVFFSQNVLNIVNGRTALYTSLVYSTNWYTRVFLQIGLFMCGVWNLDFFHFNIPPFCVAESIGNVYAAILEYVSALYPLFLVMLTFLIIELHAHNVRLIVWLYKPFHKCFVQFRRTWDIKRSIINAFSTFLLLSYTKVIIVSFKLLNRTTLRSINGNIVSILLRIDPQIPYFGRKHAPFAVFAVLVLTVLVIPILLLLLYPTKLFQKLIGRCQCRATHAVHVFVDTYQGCLKDGTSGTHDYRAVSAVFLVLRFVLLSVYVQYTEILGSGLTLIIFAILFMVLSVFIGTFKPYKKNYMTYCELFLLFLNGVFNLLIYIWLYSPNSKVIVATLLAFTFLIPHVGLVAYVLISLFHQRAISTWVKKHFCRKLC